jgi:hypothetical protein
MKLVILCVDDGCYGVAYVYNIKKNLCGPGNFTGGGGCCPYSKFTNLQLNP